MTVRIFNTGSPYNIPAGHSTDLGALRAHYEKKNVEAEEERIVRVKQMADDSEERERREAEERLLANKKGQSMLQRMGLQRPEQ